MDPIDSSPLLCPVCKEPLLSHGQMWGCKNGHPFNVAKEGYINLLLSHQRRSKNPGDDPEMVMARRRFFESGAFSVLSEGLSSLPVFQDNPISVFDCGCGEGHLLGILSEKESGFYCGLDISKKAVQVASRRWKKASWIVGNGMRDIPVSDASMDVILSILAPRNTDEFKRILKQDGTLVLGVPGPNHLIELRNRLQFSSGDFSDKADAAVEKCAPLFSETDRIQLNKEETLNREQISDLIQMTPIFWRSGNEAKEEVSKLEQLTVTVSFTLLILKPAGST